MMKRLLLVVVLSVALAACGDSAAEQNSLSVITADGREHEFQVELALTQAEQMQGLMFRDSMAENAGMLFYFPQNAERRFWMKNTLIPLDIIYIKEDGYIHHIHPNAIPHDLTGIPSNGDARAVLEINGGLAAQLDMKAGDQIKHPFFE